MTKRKPRLNSKQRKQKQKRVAIYQLVLCVLIGLMMGAVFTLAQWQAFIVLPVLFMVTAFFATIAVYDTFK